MARRGGAVHVATTKSRQKGKVYTSHLLRRSYRDGDQVKHETLGNLSHLPDALIEVVRLGLKGQAFVPADQALECIRSLPHGHVAAVVGVMRSLGVDQLLASRSSPERSRVLAMVAARLLDPRSKLALARSLAPDTATSTLGSVLQVEGCSEDDLYEALDWLHVRQKRIENKLAKRHLSAGSLILYDITSTYFEGRHCPLARLGHSRDGKRGTLQIVIGLLTTKDGCPVAVEVFEGNTGDPATVAAQVEKVRGRFGLERVVMVGDRGMLTEARIRENLASREGVSWLTSLRAPAIRKLVAAGLLQRSLFDETDLAEIHSPDFPGERLVACRNPLLADERARKRQDLLEATERELEKIRAATRRAKRPLRGADKIGLRVGKEVGRYKMAKHFEIRITETELTYERKNDAIAEEAALDGIYVIRTDLPQEEMSVDEAVTTYKRLSVVERAFRCMKSMDLKVRPIHHRKEERVRAHVFVCMLAYYVEWHMRSALAPMLFEDDDEAGARVERTSPVAKAKRSRSALAKAATKRTSEGGPVHSFQTVLADLATIVRNRVRPPGVPEAAFDMVTIPTLVQRRAFELLGVNLTV